MNAGITLGDFDVSLKSVQISYATAEIAALNISEGLKFSSGISFLGKWMQGGKMLPLPPQTHFSLKLTDLLTTVD